MNKGRRQEITEGRWKEMQGKVLTKGKRGRKRRESRTERSICRNKLTKKGGMNRRKRGQAMDR